MWGYYDMWKEFKKFALRGNVLDLAVGVIIGGAFGKIVASLVNDIIMPIIGLVTAGADFKSLGWVLKDAVMSGDTIIQAAVVIKYGSFMQNVLDFFIIALTIFLMVRAITLKRRKEEEKQALEKAAADAEKARLAALEPKVPTIPELLTEIRDLLQKESKS